jgi:hypothetical protein
MSMRGSSVVAFRVCSAQICTCHLGFYVIEILRHMTLRSKCRGESRQGGDCSGVKQTLASSVKCVPRILESVVLPLRRKKNINLDLGSGKVLPRLVQHKMNRTCVRSHCGFGYVGSKVWINIVRWNRPSNSPTIMQGPRRTLDVMRRHDRKAGVVRDVDADPRAGVVDCRGGSPAEIRAPGARSMLW